MSKFGSFAKWHKPLKFTRHYLDDLGTRSRYQFTCWIDETNANVFRKFGNKDETAWVDTFNQL